MRRLEGIYKRLLPDELMEVADAFGCAYLPPPNHDSGYAVDVVLDIPDNGRMYPKTPSDGQTSEGGWIVQGAALGDSAAS